MRAWATASSLCFLLLVGSARAQPAGEDESAALVEEGRAALRGKHYGDAADALDQAIALNPRRIEAYVLRAAVHAARHEYVQGVALLRRAQKIARDNPDVLAALGTQLFLGGDVPEGVAVLEQVVAADPARYEAQSLLGRHYARQEAWTAAIGALEAYLAARPASLAGADSVYQLDLAESYLRARRPSDARTLYAAVLTTRPDDVAARMGHAWALAAIDCRDARGALAKLKDLVVDHPEVLLVQGQCELALGAPDAALKLGERYLRAVEAHDATPAATGYALVGEAAAGTGDLALAKESLGKARALEPTKRRWGLKLAGVLRRSGDGDGALAELDAMGAPATPADDAGWWRELGEAMIVADQAAAATTRLQPALDALPDDALLSTIAGEAAVRAGDTTRAVRLLGAIGEPTDRSRAWLVRAYVALADWAAADRVAGGADPDIARNLGIVRLQAGQAADAVEPLARAAAAEPAAETLIALGRAYVETGDVGQARDAYRRAAEVASGTPLAVSVAIDRAALEVEAGDGAAALDAITAAAAEAKGATGDVATAYAEASRASHHAAGVAALQAGSATKAVTLLTRADELAGGKDVAVRCDLALAAVASGDRDAALKRLRAVQKVTCPFEAPADTQAVPILIAFTEGLEAKKAEKALKALAKLDKKATGATRKLLATATRVVALGAADKAYRDGDLKKARKMLTQAKKAPSRAGADELDLNLAVLDVADGVLADAKAVLERLVARLPEAGVSLGVIADREGDAAEALARWRAARKAGVRFTPLEDWITAKERIYGKAGEP